MDPATNPSVAPMSDFERALLARVDQLVTALTTNTAVQSGLMAALVQNTAASEAVAKSHAQLLAALLDPNAPDREEVAPTEAELTLAHSAVLDGDGNAR